MARGDDGGFPGTAAGVAAGGRIAFEVGEVRRGEIKLEETVLGCGLAAGLRAELILINDQEFTKTANCWGVDNNAKGDQYEPDCAFLQGVRRDTNKRKLRYGDGRKSALF